MQLFQANSSRTLQVVIGNVETVSDIGRIVRNLKQSLAANDSQIVQRNHIDVVDECQQNIPADLHNTDSTMK